MKTFLCLLVLVRKCVCPRAGGSSLCVRTVWSVGGCTLREWTMNLCVDCLQVCGLWVDVRVDAGVHVCMDSPLVYAWVRGRAKRGCESPRPPPGAVRRTDPGPVRAGPAPRLKRNLGSNRAAEGAEERTRRRLPSPAEGLPGSWEKFSHGGVGSQEWAPLAPRIFPRPSAPPPRPSCLPHLHPH